jgi:hypothetical protein
MRATRVFSLSIALAAASTLAHAQTFHQVEVNLPYAITAGSTAIPAGNYEIRPMADVPNGFGLYKDGTTLETMMLATPIQHPGDNIDTSVVLRVDGDNYRLSQLWIDGVTGYQFTLPKAAKSSERVPHQSLTIKAERG